MANPENKTIPTRVKDKAVDGVLWTAEKSIYVTLPAAAVIVAFTPVTLGMAALPVGLDLGGSKIAGVVRSRRKGN